MSFNRDCFVVCIQDIISTMFLIIELQGPEIRSGSFGHDDSAAKGYKLSLHPWPFPSCVIVVLTFLPLCTSRFSLQDATLNVDAAALRFAVGRCRE